jgi:hypothetical protein
MKTKLILVIPGTLLLDALAVLFIYYLSDISGLIGYPMYMLEPMRMMVILAIAFTPRWNGFILALLLPLVSYYFGGHPHLLKTSLMVAELLLNVWLFWFLFDRIKLSILAMLLSILFSKSIYYLLKYLFIRSGHISGDLVSTPIDTQVITTIAFSVFILIVFLFRGKPKKR